MPPKQTSTPLWKWQKARSPLSLTLSLANHKSQRDGPSGRKQPLRLPGASGQRRNVPLVAGNLRLSQVASPRERPLPSDAPAQAELARPRASLLAKARRPRQAESLLKPSEPPLNRGPREVRHLGHLNLLPPHPGGVPLSDAHVSRAFGSSMKKPQRGGDSGLLRFLTGTVMGRGIPITCALT